MNTNAYSTFSKISPKKLLSDFKAGYRNISEENRLMSLNQGYQSLAKYAHFSSLEAMLAQNSVLIQASEFADALASCGLSRPINSTDVTFAKLLKCDVLCMRNLGNLCVAISDDAVVIDTPYLDNPRPYSPNTSFYALSVNSDNGAWLTNDEWCNFVRTLRKDLDFERDIEEQIEAIWSCVSPDYCGELFLSEYPDSDDLAVSSEGRFRQIVLKHSGHTCVDLVYDYFSAERETHS